jgi:hypothetical protein
VTDRDIVVIVWRDAHADRSGGWVMPEHIDADPYRVTSIGWRIEDKPGHVSIAQSRGDDGALDHVLHIPAAMVEIIRCPTK